MKVLVTGSGGLIGSESARFFLGKKASVTGIDNNKRKYFFGEMGDVSKNLESLSGFPEFTNIPVDITNREAVSKVFKENGPFDLVIHTAAQPSHDWARKDPTMDFSVNALGTLNLLEEFRTKSPDESSYLPQPTRSTETSPTRSRLSRASQGTTSIRSPGGPTVLMNRCL